MIVKLQSISHLKNALSYCERGGETIHSNKCLGNSDHIFNQMRQHNAFNDRCIKQSFHIKIRLAPEDKGRLTTQNWLDISKDYANKIGYQNNPYVVYIHEEGTEKEHIHIVASRIRENNTAVSDSYTHYQNLDFSRTIENKYDLRKVKRKLEKLQKQEVFQYDNKRMQQMKETIAFSIKKSTSMMEFISVIKKQKITVKIGRGIVFTDEKGAKFKGSQIDRQYSLKGIDKLIQDQLINKTPYLGRGL